MPSQQSANISRRFSFVNQNPVDRDLEQRPVNNHRIIDANHLHDRLRELENFDIEHQYRRVSETCTAALPPPQVPFFSLDF